MISTATLRYLRIAPRKVRMVTDLIRGENAEKAQVVLNFTRKGAALSILKLLNQAISNAENNFQVDKKNLYISKILVDEGPKAKRFFPRARGKADVIQKKTSHVMITLDEIKKKSKKKKVKKIKKAKLSKVTEKEKEEIKKDEKEIKALPRKAREEKRPTKGRPEKTKGLRSFFRRKSF